MLEQNDATTTPNAANKLCDVSSFNSSGDGPFPSSDQIELPKLASNVRLAGRLNGVGFQERQWLVQRDGRFVQMTELLYRIAEQANGHHTVDTIAKNVTNSTEWLVDAADVTQLIHSKLLPLGLMANSPCQNQSDPSPLGVNIRFRTLGPRFIEPITSVLHILCNWVIVSAVVIAVAIGHWWLYRIHGVERGVHEAIYTPGGVLLALMLVLLAAAFHEFGHASALKHHGGNVGNMGIALYIIYPALYTDVTDNYRLSRWARISTDLGGIYFHLIFALGLFGVYFVSHRELFLLCVLLIDLEIIQQFIPVIRLDGYWLMADITGIPDFFSQMAPFLRTLLPSRMRATLEQKVPLAAGLGGNRLPDVKTWVKVAFFSYILVTVPLLIYLFALMVITLPELITTTWGGLQAQIGMLRAIDIRKDFFIAVLLLLQIVFLTLPLPGTLYLLWIMTKGPFNSFVDWASRTPRNAFAGIGGVIACCGVAAAFVFVSPSSHRAQSPSLNGDRLIGEVQSATTKLNSLTADLEGSIGEDHFTGTMVLKRPNFARVEINGTKGLGKTLLVSDGKRAITYFFDSNQYVQTQPGDHGEFIQSTIVEQVEQFFHPDSITGGTHFEYLGHRSDEGTEYDLVGPKDKPASDETFDYFISPTDKLIHRTMSKEVLAKQPGTWTALKNLRIDPNLDPSLFSWTQPRTAKTLQLPAGVQLPLK